MTKPALIAEEWKQALPNPREQDSVFDQADTPELQHYIAAIALHGQEFGFTWDDVDMLRWHADQIFGENQLPANQLKNLAGRIEALLPPRAQ